jgi:glycosyltransferase involved in cell wall biosynthesis
MNSDNPSKKHSIVIDTIPLLSKLTGIGKYTFEITSRLMNAGQDLDFNFYYGYYSKNLYLPGAPSSGGLAKGITKILGNNYAFKKIARFGTLLLLKLLPGKFDLYWEPATAPLRHIKCRRLITTVHDFTFHLYPHWLQKENRQYIVKHFWKNIHRSDLIITGSEYTKKEIIEFLHIDPSRIHVIYHGVDHDNFKVYDSTILTSFADTHKIPEKFILFVGSIEPRKNLANTLLAYNSLSADFKKEFKFLLAGFSGWNNAAVMRIIDQDKANIINLGYLTDLELAYLYNLASVFIYPSLYEGFGLPPLEAMACGAPVITSRAASLPEVCGEAAYYVDAHDVADIAQGIYAVSTDEAMRTGMAQKSLEQAKLFSWEKSADAHLAVFHEILR